MKATSDEAILKFELPVAGLPTSSDSPHQGGGGGGGGGGQAARMRRTDHHPVDKSSLALAMHRIKGAHRLDIDSHSMRRSGPP